MRFKHITLLLFLVVTFRFAAASGADFSIGVALGASTSPYKSHDGYLMVSPFAGYDSERFYLQASDAGVYLLKAGGHAIGAGVSYSWLEFDPDDCDDWRMKRLDKRRSTLMAGLTYSYTGRLGIFRTKVLRDILGWSDGFSGEASYHFPLMWGGLTLLPGAGVTWNSSKHADYYFGVSRSESARSGLRAHTAKASVSPFVSLEGKYTITERWSVVASARMEMLAGSIKRSPMTGRSCTVSGAVGIQFTF